MITDIDKAHLAGVLDVMGRIGVEKEMYLSIQLSTKKLDVIQYLCNMTGTTLVPTEREFLRVGCVDHCKEQHQHVTSRSSRWKLVGAKATIILWNVRPYIKLQRSHVDMGLSLGMLNRDAWKSSTVDWMRERGWEIPGRTINV
jgi:hypothetical protein